MKELTRLQGVWVTLVLGSLRTETNYDFKHKSLGDSRFVLVFLLIEEIPITALRQEVSEILFVATAAKIPHQIHPIQLKKNKKTVLFRVVG